VYVLSVKEGVSMYTFDEVIRELDNAISVKTLKSWANRVEKITDTHFTRNFAKNAAGRSYNYKVFSLKQVQQFKYMILLRKEKVSLDEAILKSFLSDEEKRKRETIEVNKKEFTEFKEDTKQLIELSKRLIEENQELKKRILEIENVMKLLKN
jgi:DNA-binding transcriptional MerR regulator